MGFELGTLLSRRRLMTSLGAGAGALLLPLRMRAEEAATGHIASGNVRDAAQGRGIAGVMVSNGRDVVVTDALGRWELPVRSGEPIFVIKPPHWSVAGGPQAWFRRVAPSNAQADERRASIDFALVRQPEPTCFDALLVADTQPANRGEFGYVRDAMLRAAAGSNAQFVLHHGDVTGDDLSLLEDHQRLAEETGIPWHHCPGNHDMDREAGDGATAFRTWKALLGPTHYAFQFGGATFILLNNVDPLGPGRPRYRGRIGEEQLAFVGKVLAHVPHDQLVVVSMHIPLASFDTPLDPANTTADRSRLLALLAQRPYAVSFAGHSHTTEHHYFPGDGFSPERPHHHHVLTAASGSWWSGPLDATGAPRAVSRDGSPKGFHVLSIDGNRYTTTFAPFDPAEQPLVRLLAADASLGLLVNVFDGGPRTQVTCEVDGEPESQITLQRACRTDPYAEAFFARNAALCKPWVCASLSSHLWTSTCPPGHALSAALVLRVRDEYGRIHERRVAVPNREANARQSGGLVNVG